MMRPNDSTGLHCSTKQWSQRCWLTGSESGKQGRLVQADACKSIGRSVCSSQVIYAARSIHGKVASRVMAGVVDQQQPGLGARPLHGCKRRLGLGRVPIAPYVAIYDKKGLLVKKRQRLDDAAGGLE